MVLVIILSLSRINKFIKNNDSIIYYLSIINYYINTFKHDAVARPNKILWVNPNSINYNVKLSLNKDKTIYKGAIKEGEWDLEIKSFNEHKKHVSMKQFFLEGVSWENTKMFKKNYQVKIKEGNKARGYSNLEGLINYYHNNVESLFEKIKNEGFKIPEKRLNKNDMYVYIDRNGQILLGTNGNHRLSIAKIIGLKKIPVRVHIRHKEWQNTRDMINKSITNDELKDSRLLNHPDLQDVIDNQY